MGSFSSQLSRLRKLSTANSILQEKGEHQELKKTTLRGVGTSELKQAGYRNCYETPCSPSANI